MKALEVELTGDREEAERYEGYFNRYQADSERAVADLKQQLWDERGNTRFLRQRVDEHAATIADLRKRLVAANAGTQGLIVAAPAPALPQPGPPVDATPDGSASPPD